MRHAYIIAQILMALSVQAAAAASPSEACLAEAKAWFNSNHPKSTQTLKSGATIEVQYTAHYIGSVSRCFVRRDLTMTSASKSLSMSNSAVVEMNGGKTKLIAKLALSGATAIRQCELDGRKCQSAKEWEAFVSALLKK